METALTNIFKEPEPTETVVRISSFLGNLRYKAVDAQGRKYTVRSDSPLSINAYYTVQLGRVIGTARPFPVYDRVSV